VSVNEASFMDCTVSSPDVHLLNGQQPLGQRFLPLPSLQNCSICFISAERELRALGTLEQSCSCFEVHLLTAVTSQASLKDVTK